MYRSALLTVLVLSWTEMSLVSLHAEAPFFWDEFDRQDLLGTEISWNVVRGATVELADSTLSFTPLADNFPGIGVVIEPLEDFTVRTRLRFHDPINYAINPWIGLYGRNRSGLVSYWAGPAADGSVYIGESDAGRNMIRSQRHLFSREEILTQDIELEFTAVGEEISLFAWLADSDRPTDPALVMRDDTLKDGNVGITLNPSDHLTGFDLRYFALLPGTPGDFNASTDLEDEDIALLAAEIRSGGTNRVYDLNEDAGVDNMDLRVLIGTHFGTFFGDSNLNGEFNSEDLVSVLQAGEYEDGIDGNSTWATGDWDGSGDFDTGDLTLAFQDGGYEQGPRQALVSVPEPAGYGGFLAGLACVTRLAAARRICRRRTYWPRRG